MVKKKREKEEPADLQEAIAEIKQRFGEGAIMRLSEARAMDVETVSTGSISLDMALGVGGLPKGRVIEIYGPEAAGKCVRSDTIVFSELGMTPISVFGNPQIAGFQQREIFVHSEHSYEKTSHFYNGGIKPTIKVKTSYGYEIEGTPNHRIRVLDAEGKYLWRRLDNVQVGDFVPIQRGQDYFGKGVDLSDFEERVWKGTTSRFNTSKKDFKNFRITKELAKLTGFMVGDGTCTSTGLNKNDIQITLADDEVQRELDGICMKIFAETPKITNDKRTKDTRRAVIHNGKARAFLAYAGVNFSSAGDKEVPWSILCSPKSIVASFLSALFECDGSAGKRRIEYASKSEKLVAQLQIILLNFGIVSRRIVRHNTIYDRDYYYLYIEGQKDRDVFARDIGFLSTRKQGTLLAGIQRRKIYKTNRDTIPHLNEKLGRFLVAYRKLVRETNREDWKLITDYVPQGVSPHQLTYHQLERILRHFSDGEHLPEYQELENLYELEFFWDRVATTENSMAHVFDFTVPSNATFIGNGFVNHNTTVALHALAEVQKNGGTAAFVDAEHALDPDYAKRIGVDVQQLLISQPDSGEQALQIVETLVRSGQVDMIVIDSVAALTPRNEIAGEMGEFQIGLQARLMSSALRKLSAIVAKTGTTVIFLNQIRMKIGVLYGNPETTPGGLALKFYSSVRIELRRAAQIKHGEEIVGSRVKAKIVKNKVAPPFKTCEFDIYYNEGISSTADLLNAGLRYELLSRAGSWLQYGSTKLGLGVEAARTYLKEHPDEAERLRKEILEQGGKPEEKDKEPKQN